MAFQLNGSPINIYRPFVTNDGVKYPDLRDATLRAALGVTEVADPPEYDRRFYHTIDTPRQLEDTEEVDRDGNPVYVKTYDQATESMVDTDVRLVRKGLKSDWIAQVKQTAGSLLAKTDWMVIRKAERDVAIPATTVAYRAAVVAEADRLEAAILACTDVPGLITVVEAQAWPKAE